MDEVISNLGEAAIGLSNAASAVTDRAAGGVGNLASSVKGPDAEVANVSIDQQAVGDSVDRSQALTAQAQLAGSASERDTGTLTVDPAMPSQGPDQGVAATR